ncbi:MULTISPECIES: hypothetical protein [unclassified Rhodosalinus]|uniref:hypothetical protein n=1 Tax=unclassified Rhodosalinus TaxID=2630183 RepID=UPI0035263815
MDADTALVIGLGIGVFAIPAMVSAYSERRVSRVAMLALLGAGGLVVWALAQKPGGYRLADVPEAVIAVIGRVLQ